MTRKEQDAFRLIEGGLELLRNAIAHGDPHKELELRANDLLRDVRAIAWPDLASGMNVHDERLLKLPRFRYRRAVR